MSEALKVAVRIKPGCENDGLQIINDTIVVESGRRAELKHYKFDSLFLPDSSQKDVYDTVGIQVIENVLNGYNHCLFAFGQTGSGKTYTMTGDDIDIEKNNTNSQGLFPRICDTLIQQSQNNNHDNNNKNHCNNNNDIIIQISAVEIFMEKLSDLLAPDALRIINAQGQTQLSRSKNVDFSNYAGLSVSGQQLKIREHPDRGCHVHGATIITVKNCKEVNTILKRAARIRSVAATHMNLRSSRSHAVYTIYVSQLDHDNNNNNNNNTNEKKNSNKHKNGNDNDNNDSYNKTSTTSGRHRSVPSTRRRISKICLVDLAGSENNRALHSQSSVAPLPHTLTPNPSTDNTTASNHINNNNNNNNNNNPSDETIVSSGDKGYHSSNMKTTSLVSKIKPNIHVNHIKDRMRESAAINRSLLALGRVVAALAHNSTIANNSKKKTNGSINNNNSRKQSIGQVLDNGQDSSNNKKQSKSYLQKYGEKKKSMKQNDKDRERFTRLLKEKSDTYAQQQRNNMKDGTDISLKSNSSASVSSVTATVYSNISHTRPKTAKSSASTTSASTITSVGGSLNTRMVPPPYRDSQLTMLLRDCLGGSAYCTMVATLRSDMVCVDETASTLRFASQARGVKSTPGLFNKAEPISEATTGVIRKLRKEVHQLKQELSYYKQYDDDQSQLTLSLLPSLRKSRNHGINKEKDSDDSDDSGDSLLNIHSEKQVNAVKEEDETSVATSYASSVSSIPTSNLSQPIHGVTSVSASDHEGSNENELVMRSNQSIDETKEDNGSIENDEDEFLPNTKVDEIDDGGAMQVEELSPLNDLNDDMPMLEVRISKSTVTNAIISTAVGMNDDMPLFEARSSDPLPVGTTNTPTYLTINAPELTPSSSPSRSSSLIIGGQETSPATVLKDEKDNEEIKEVEILEDAQVDTDIHTVEPVLDNKRDRGATKVVGSAEGFDSLRPAYISGYTYIYQKGETPADPSKSNNVFTKRWCEVHGGCLLMSASPQEAVLEVLNLPGSTVSPLSLTMTDQVDDEIGHDNDIMMSPSSIGSLMKSPFTQREAKRLSDMKAALARYDKNDTETFLFELTIGISSGVVSNGTPSASPWTRSSNSRGATFSNVDTDKLSVSHLSSSSAIESEISHSHVYTFCVDSSEDMWRWIRALVQCASYPSQFQVLTHSGFAQTTRKTYTPLPPHAPHTSHVTMMATSHPDTSATVSMSGLGVDDTMSNISLFGYDEVHHRLLSSQNSTYHTSTIDGTSSSRIEIEKDIEENDHQVVAGHAISTTYTDDQDTNDSSLETKCSIQ